MHVFTALKFAPSRCPACEAPFSQAAAFRRWAGLAGGSFVEAQSHQLRLYPELYAPAGGQPDALAWANPHRADFIACRGCGNKTLRIALDERTVASREEAERLLSGPGYTCIVETEIPPGSSLEDVQEAERRMREQGLA